MQQHIWLLCFAVTIRGAQVSLDITPSATYTIPQCSIIHLTWSEAPPTHPWIVPDCEVSSRDQILHDFGVINTSTAQQSTVIAGYISTCLQDRAYGSTVDTVTLSSYGSSGLRVSTVASSSSPLSLQSVATLLSSTQPSSVTHGSTGDSVSSHELTLSGKLAALAPPSTSSYIPLMAATAFSTELVVVTLSSTQTISVMSPSTHIVAVTSLSTQVIEVTSSSTELMEITSFSKELVATTSSSTELVAMTLVSTQSVYVTSSSTELVYTEWSSTKLVAVTSHSTHIIDVTLSSTQSVAVTSSTSSAPSVNMTSSPLALATMPSSSNGSTTSFLSVPSTTNPSSGARAATGSLHSSAPIVGGVIGGILVTLVIVGVIIMAKFNRRRGRVANSDSDGPAQDRTSWMTPYNMQDIVESLNGNESLRLGRGVIKGGYSYRGMEEEPTMTADPIALRHGDEHSIHAHELYMGSSEADISVRNTLPPAYQYLN